jgi:hypothetical protein
VPNGKGLSEMILGDEPGADAAQSEGEG